MPGFTVGVVEAGAAVAAAAEKKAGASAGGVKRDDVPSIFGDDVGREEVDFAGQVGDGASVDAAMGVDAVEAFEKLGGTFHLDAPEGRGGVGWERAFSSDLLPVGMLSVLSVLVGGIDGQECPSHMVLLGRRMREDFAGVEDNVVAFAVAVGAGYTEAEVGGFEDEGQFGEFSATLSVEFALAWSLGRFPCGLLLDRPGARR